MSRGRVSHLRLANGSHVSATRSRSTWAERPDACVGAAPATSQSNIGVDVPVESTRSRGAPGGDDRNIPVDVHHHLIYLERWKRVPPQVLDVFVLFPDLSGRTVEVRE
jgi:hypothetical protein